MQMIRHIVDGDQFLFLAGDDAGDEFLQFIIVFRRDEILPAFNGEHDVDINLRVGVCHTRNMSLLTELENPFYLDSTKMSRLRRCFQSFIQQPLQFRRHPHLPARLMLTQRAAHRFPGQARIRVHDFGERQAGGERLQNERHGNARAAHTRASAQMLRVSDNPVLHAVKLWQLRNKSSRVALVDDVKNFFGHIVTLFQIKALKTIRVVNHRGQNRLDDFLFYRKQCKQPQFDHLERGRNFEGLPCLR